MRKKILLTGGSGFIGSALKPKLIKMGYDVRAPKIDITNYDKMRKYIKANKPDYLIHLASINSIMYSFEHPLEVLKINFVATVNIAEACKGLKYFKQFIFASSTEVYGDVLKDKNGKLDEMSKLCPNNPHAVAKLASEFYIEQMGKVHGFPYTIFRPSNTYGRTKDSGFLVENVVTSMLSNKTVKLGNPEIVKDFIFIEDHVSAYTKALGNKNAIGEIINICTGKGYSIKEVANKAAMLTKYKGKIEWNSVPKRPIESKIVIGNNSKAKEMLDWQPKYTLKEGLEKTIEYWRKSGEAK